MDTTKTRLESEVLVGPNIGGDIDEGSSAKTHGFGLDDFTDKSMWGDETDENNQ